MVCIISLLCGLSSSVNSATCFWVSNEWVCLPDDIIINASINWESLSEDIQSDGINWDTLSDDIQSSGINWDDVIGQEINPDGINWFKTNNYGDGKTLKARSSLESGINWE